MSIVTTAAAVPSRLFTLFAALADMQKGELRERLQGWSTPPSLAARGGSDDEDASSALFTTSLAEARRMGLIEEVDGRLSVAAAVVRRTGGRNREEEFRAHVTKVLFSLDLAADAGQQGFMYALAWFLTQGVAEPLEFGRPPQDAVRRDMGDLWERTDLTNLNRYQNFLYWARFLGFASLVGDGANRRAVPDPTVAIAAALPMMFADGVELGVDQFMAGLAARYPVLEGGEVRRRVEEMREVPSGDDAKLSPATSFALLRLSERGRLVLETVADARSIILDTGTGTRRVSRIRLGGAM